MSPQLFVVRISPSRKTPVKDFEKFMSDIVHTREGIWDTDHENKMIEGDYLAFILGPKGKTMMYIFKVTKKMSVNDRKAYWKDNAPYTKNNGTCAVGGRPAIKLTNEHSVPFTYDWAKFKGEVGYAPNNASWMPQSTLIVKRVLPFELD
jgi:hypothetical protein